MQKLAGYVIWKYVFHIAKLCEPHLYSVSFKNVWLRYGISKTVEVLLLLIYSSNFIFINLHKNGKYKLAQKLTKLLKTCANETI